MKPPRSSQNKKGGVHSAAGATTEEEDDIRDAEAEAEAKSEDEAEDAGSANIQTPPYEQKAPIAVSAKQNKKKAKKEASARAAATRTLLCIVKLIAGWIFSTPWRPGMPAQCAGGNEPAGIKSGASANDWKRCSSLTTKNPA
jgi:hypothetical protein